MNYQTQDDHKIFYKKRGDGDKSLLFLHGWAHNHTVWLDEVSHLENTYTCYLPDLRGHGQSDKPQEGYTLKRFTKDVDNLIRHENLESYVLIGHSMGGMISLHHQATRQTAEGLILTDTALTINQAFLENTYIEKFIHALENLDNTAYTYEEDVDLRGWDNEYVAFLRGMQNTPIHVITSCLDMLLNVDLTEKAKRVKLPTLILHGRQDTVVGKEQAKELNDAMPNSDLYMLDDMHNPMLGHPEQCTKLALNYLNTLP